MAEKENVKAEFSMGLMDYERFNALLMEMERIAVRFYKGERNATSDYYAILQTFYRPSGLRAAIASKTIKNELDDAFIEVERCKNKIVQRRLLEKLSDRVLEVRQNMGIGIPIFMKKSERAQMHAGFKR